MKELVGEKIEITNTVIESKYYKKGGVFEVIYQGPDFDMDEKTIIINNGMVLIESEYKLLGE